VHKPLVVVVEHVDQAWEASVAVAVVVAAAMEEDVVDHHRCNIPIIRTFLNAICGSVSARSTFPLNFTK
jgi:hypothetical protein